MKILFVEDKPESIETILAEIESEDTGIDARCEVVDFKDPEGKIKDYDPDILVLDLFAGDIQEGNERGFETHHFIWEEYQFCPIIVFSANAKAYSEEHEEAIEHPFIECIEKGSVDSKDKMLETLIDFSDKVLPLQETHKFINSTISSVLKDIAPYAFNNNDDEEEIKKILKRASRRRLAAFVDEVSDSEDKLLPWEHYIFPPIKNDLQLADIIKNKSGESDDPDSFFLVLTPSCDLNTKHGEAKVDEVLVAECISSEEMLEQMGGLAPETGNETLKNRLPGDILRSGYSRDLLPLPSLENRIPSMAANLRSLKLIPLDNIGEDQQYKCIASMDSPFRELVSWAYQQIACRPGLPARDCESWAEEIITDLE